MTVMSLSACGSGETKNDTAAVGKTAEAGKTTAAEKAVGDNAAEKAAGDNAGDKTAEKTVEGKAAGKAATIRYEWWGGSATHEAYTGLQARYKELKPEVTIEPEYSAFDGYQEKVVTQLAGGTIADLFHIDAPWMQEWVSRGDYFVDLSKQDILDYSGIGQELLDQYCMFDGKLLAVPMGVQCSGMLVNTAAAQKYGLEIDRQLTWEEIIDLGEKLHTADPEAAEILGSVRAVPTSKTQQEAAVSAGVLRQPVIDALDEAYTNVQVKDNEPSQNSELQDAMTDEFSKVVYGMATPEEAVESTFGTLEEVLERISK